MIGDKAREIIAQARRMSYPTRLMININVKPLEFMEGPDTNPDIISTHGTYHLVFNTRTRNGEVNVKKFNLVFDFGRGFVKCSNYYELKKQAETNEHVRFLLKYTNLCPRLFTIAKLNEGMQIPVCLDIAKIDDEIRASVGNTNKEEYIMSYNSFKPTETTWWKEENGRLKMYDLERPDFCMFKEDITRETK